MKPVKPPVWSCNSRKLPQVIDPLFVSLDVSVEHRAGAAATHLMPDTMDFEPFPRCLFATTNLIAHTGIENLRPATGERTEPGLTQTSRASRGSIV